MKNAGEIVQKVGLLDVRFWSMRGINAGRVREWEWRVVKVHRLVCVISLTSISYFYLLSERSSRLEALFVHSNENLPLIYSIMLEDKTGTDP